MSEIKLKKCPFCGSDAILEEKMDTAYRLICRVKCSNIYHCAIKQDQWDYRENAVKAWNRRISNEC